MKLFQCNGKLDGKHSQFLRWKSQLCPLQKWTILWNWETEEQSSDWDSLSASPNKKLNTEIQNDQRQWILDGRGYWSLLYYYFYTVKFSNLVHIHEWVLHEIWMFGMQCFHANIVYSQIIVVHIWVLEIFENNFRITFVPKYTNMNPKVILLWLKSP